jgi:hypothetical protein
MGNELNRICKSCLRLNAQYIRKRDQPALLLLYMEWNKVQSSMAFGDILQTPAHPQFTVRLSDARASVWTSHSCQEVFPYLASTTYS